MLGESLPADAVGEQVVGAQRAGALEAVSGRLDGEVVVEAVERVDRGGHLLGIEDLRHDREAHVADLGEVSLAIDEGGGGHARMVGR